MITNCILLKNVDSILYNLKNNTLENKNNIIDVIFNVEVKTLNGKHESYRNFLLKYSNLNKETFVEGFENFVLNDLNTYGDLELLKESITYESHLNELFYNYLFYSKILDCEVSFEISFNCILKDSYLDNYLSYDFFVPTAFEMTRYIPSNQISKLKFSM